MKVSCDRKCLFSNLIASLVKKVSYNCILCLLNYFMEISACGCVCCMVWIQYTAIDPLSFLVIPRSAKTQSQNIFHFKTFSNLFHFHFYHPWLSFLAQGSSCHSKLKKVKCNVLTAKKSEHTHGK